LSIASELYGVITHRFKIIFLDCRRILLALLRFNEAGRKLSMLLANASGAGDMLAAQSPNPYPPTMLFTKQKGHWGGGYPSPRHNAWRI